MSKTVKTFTVSPIPIKRRPRFLEGKYVYTDAATKADLRRVAEAYSGIFYASEPMALVVDIYGQLPIGRIKYGAEPFTIKPDVDNVVKCVMDGLTGKAYADDKQVVFACGYKHPRTVKRIGEYVTFTLMPFDEFMNHLDTFKKRLEGAWKLDELSA